MSEPYSADTPRSTSLRVDEENRLESSAAGTIQQRDTQQDAGPARIAQSVPGELLIKFRERTSATAIDNTLYRKQLRKLSSYRIVPGLQRVKLAPGVSVEDAMADYMAQPDVEYVEPNYIVSKSAVPNDTSYASQWSLNNTGQTGGVANSDIDAPEAWDITQGSSNVVVAVIDTGVDYTHQDLAANIYRNTADCNTNSIDDDGNGYVDDCNGIDTANGDSNPLDDDGHGTHVAGILGAVGNNGIGITGVAWNVKILPCKFLDDTGIGNIADAIACLDYVATMKDRGVNIVATNNSWGDGIYSQALYDAIARQMQRGILFVAAAGNEAIDIADSWKHRDGSVFPCAYSLPNVICVAAAKNNDDYYFERTGIGTNWGRQTVHVVAPGVNILSTLPGNTYGTLTGTSMAAPHVAGVVALMNSVASPLDWKGVRNTILASGDLSVYLHDAMLSEWKVVSARRVNARNALTCSNRTLTNRMLPRTMGQVIGPHHAGETLKLAVLNINCGNPGGVVSVHVEPGNIDVQLLDDGAGTDVAAGDGIYSGTWTPTEVRNYSLTFPGTGQDDAGHLVTDTIVVSVDGFLKDGFPIRTLHSGGTFQGDMTPTVVGDIRGVGTLDIVATGRLNGPTYAWDYQGKPTPNFPRTVSDERFTNLTTFLSLGNLSGSRGALEIVAGYTAGFRPDLSPVNGSIEAWSGSGALLPNWPRAALNSISSSATLVDIDGDDKDEIFVGLGSGNLMGFHSDGTAVAGFPIPGGASPLAADMDFDGFPDLAFIQDDALELVHHDGTRFAGFPVALATHNLIGASIVAIGDVDGDGELEILGAATEQLPSGNKGRFVLFKADGTIKRTFDASPQTEAATPQALADMNGDGIPEIVSTYSIVDSYWHTYRKFVNVTNGLGVSLPGWPKELTGLNQIDQGYRDSAAKVGDVDGDGAPEIVLIGMARLHVLKADGTYVTNFPRQLPNQIVYYNASSIDPVIADLEGDGRNDIILTNDLWDGRAGYFNKIWAYDLHGPAAYGPIEWGQYREGVGHRSYYETGRNLKTQSYLATRVHGSGAITSQTAGINCGNDCIERYANNTSVTLTATPDSGMVLAGWQGACSGRATTCTVSVSRYTAVSAVFTASQLPLTVAIAGTGFGSYGTVQSSPAGISCPADCSENYSAGSTITLTATPTANFAFSKWTGACAGAATATCTVTMTAAKSVTANFVAKVDLTITRDGNGNGTVTSTPSGINCGTTCSALFAPLSTVTLTAVPAADSVFVGWGAACSGTATCETSMIGARQVTATFALKPMLTVARAGTGAGTVTSSPAGIDCGSDCSENFAMNASVTLTAVAAANSVFTGWSGACTNTTTTCTVTMSAARSVTANFAANFALPFTLTVIRNGAGSGTVSSTPAGINCGANCSASYAPNTSVTLRAAVAAGTVFTGWTGACSGTTISCTVTMDASKSVSATFSIASAPTAALEVSRVGTGSGAVTSAPAGIDCGTSCLNTFALNTSITLTATASNDSTFDSWSGACSGTGVCTISLDTAKTAIAHFTLKPTLSVVLNGNGSVNSTPAGIDCGTICTAHFNPDAVVTLTAVAAQGSQFENWTGACAGQSTSCTLTMNAAKQSTANFRATSNPGTGATGSGGGGGGGAFQILWLLLLGLIYALKHQQASAIRVTRMASLRRL